MKCVETNSHRTLHSLTSPEAFKSRITEKLGLGAVQDMFQDLHLKSPGNRAVRLPVPASLFGNNVICCREVMGNR